jgi:hypothetical protein
LPSIVREREVELAGLDPTMTYQMKAYLKDNATSKPWHTWDWSETFQPSGEGREMLPPSV